jgi:hypothetical protein
MIDSLPAAWAVCTNGAAIAVADAAAVLATNCRRVSFVFRISFLQLCRELGPAGS